MVSYFDSLTRDDCECGSGDPLSARLMMMYMGVTDNWRERVISNYWTHTRAHLITLTGAQLLTSSQWYNVTLDIFHQEIPRDSLKYIDGISASPAKIPRQIVDFLISKNASPFKILSFSHFNSYFDETKSIFMLRIL